MSTTDTTSAVVANIDDALNDEAVAHEMVESEDTVDAEVVADVVESDEEAAAKPKRRNRRKAAAAQDEQEVEAREVEAPQPTEQKSSLTPAKARKLTEDIKKAATNSTELFIKAWNDRIWLAYPNGQFDTSKGAAVAFLEWVKVELAEDRPRLPKAKRLELTASLKNEGRVSQTVIAEILGVDQKTVSNDLRDAEEAGTEVTRESVGSDGRTYTRSNGRTGMTKPYADRLDDMVKMAYNALEKLQELRVEDEWDTVARAYRGDFQRLSAEFGALRDTLTESDDFEDDDRQGRNVGG
jgi:DNA-binding Lrp family transcriptional regulator